MANYDKVPKKVLNQLKNEYFSLVRGITISVAVPYNFSIPVKISWQEDVSGCFYYEDNILTKNENRILTKIDDLVNKKSKKRLDRLNTQITRFCLKTKLIATKYDVSDDDIWDYLWDVQAKAGL